MLTALSAKGPVLCTNMMRRVTRDTLSLSQGVAYSGKVPLSSATVPVKAYTL